MADSIYLFYSQVLLLVSTFHASLVSFTFGFILDCKLLSLYHSPCRTQGLRDSGNICDQTLHTDAGLVKNSLALAFLMGSSRVSSVSEFLTGFSELDKCCI